LAVPAVLAGRLRRPALAHGLWLLVLLKLVTPPLVAVPLPWPALPDDTPTTMAALAPAAEPLPPEPAEQAALVRGNPEPAGAAGADEDLIVAIEPRPAGVAARPEPDGYAPWRELLVFVWAAGALAWFGVAVRRVRRFARLLRLATPAPQALQLQAAQLAGRLGLRRCPRVSLLPGRLPPLLWWLGGSPRL